MSSKRMTWVWSLSLCAALSTGCTRDPCEGASGAVEGPLAEVAGLAPLEGEDRVCGMRSSSARIAFKAEKSSRLGQLTKAYVAAIEGAGFSKFTSKDSGDAFMGVYVRQRLRVKLNLDRADGFVIATLTDESGVTNPSRSSTLEARWEAFDKAMQPVKAWLPDAERAVEQFRASGAPKACPPGALPAEGPLPIFDLNALSKAANGKGVVETPSGYVKTACVPFGHFGTTHTTPTEGPGACPAALAKTPEAIALLTWRAADLRLPMKTFDQERFDSGSFAGHLVVYSVATKAVLCGAPVRASNRPNLTLSTIVDTAANRKLEDNFEAAAGSDLEDQVRRAALQALQTLRGPGSPGRP